MGISLYLDGTYDPCERPSDLDYAALIISVQFKDSAKGHKMKEKKWSVIVQNAYSLNEMMHVVKWNL